MHSAVFRFVSAFAKVAQVLGGELQSEPLERAGPA